KVADGIFSWWIEISQERAEEPQVSEDIGLVPILEIKELPFCLGCYPSTRRRRTPGKAGLKAVPFRQQEFGIHRRGLDSRQENRKRIQVDTNPVPILETCFDQGCARATKGVVNDVSRLRICGDELSGDIGDHACWIWMKA